MQMRKFAFLLLLLSSCMGVFVIQALQAQAIPDPIVIQQATNGSIDFRAWADKIVSILVALGMVVTALCAFVILLFGKWKEAKAGYSELKERADRQNTSTLEMQKTITVVALNTPTPPTNENPVTNVNIDTH